jgi:exodeoxyribonuclease VII large subunit
VGHQIDTTLADLVADVVAPTPTAAAVVALPDGRALAQRVDGASDALDAAMARALRQRRLALAALRARLRHPAERLATARRRADELVRRAHGALERRLPACRREVATLEARLRRAVDVRLGRARDRVERLTTAAEALSPQRVLERGYAVVLGPGGVVTSVRDVAVGDALHVVVHDGRFGAMVDADGDTVSEDLG